MKIHYLDTEGRSITDLVQIPQNLEGEFGVSEGWMITRISVPKESRGKGIASLVLREMVQDADREGVVLILEPFPTGGLDYSQLISWYQRYGFRKVPGRRIMVRLPDA